LSPRGYYFDPAGQLCDSKRLNKCNGLFLVEMSADNAARRRLDFRSEISNHTFQNTEDYFDVQKFEDFLCLLNVRNAWTIFKYRVDEHFSLTYCVSRSREFIAELVSNKPSDINPVICEFVPGKFVNGIHTVVYEDVAQSQDFWVLKQIQTGESPAVIGPSISWIVENCVIDESDLQCLSGIAVMKTEIKASFAPTITECSVYRFSDSLRWPLLLRLLRQPGVLSLAIGNAFMPDAWLVDCYTELYKCTSLLSVNHLSKFLHSFNISIPSVWCGTSHVYWNSQGVSSSHFWNYATKVSRFCNPLALL
jgi:hypothetical protein